MRAYKEEDMDKAVIDELFEDDDKNKIFRHSDDEIRAELAESAAAAGGLMERIAAIRDELKSLQTQMGTEADALEDLYDDLDFSQQTLAGGPAAEMSDKADEFRSAAAELDAAIDALSDMLIFRFK